MLELIFDNKNKYAYAANQSTIDLLRNSHVGTFANDRLILSTEELLYALEVRGAKCTTTNGKKLSFGDVAKKFQKDKKFLARYFTYKDWKDKGLAIIAPTKLQFAKPAEIPIKRYPTGKINLRAYKLEGIFFPDDLITIAGDEEQGRKIYEDYWFGQYGTYKAIDHGMLNKLDIFETLFLIKHSVLKISNQDFKSIMEFAVKRRADFKKLFSVYCDWRDRNYIVKSGFKFGTHFRIYFPGAQPIKNDNWVHSRHVLHVFPRDAKLLISEWARAIRVAHSVRKTFILAIPGKSRRKNLNVDFLLYHRKGAEVEQPGKDQPKYAMLSFSEEEFIGGAELSALINEAKKLGCQAIIAIADRESSVTYYKAKMIELPGSSYEYYEIDWMQP
ncbi:MAG: tRNA-intron lyase [Candidatus Micrarchaeaceae archaeon]